MVIGLMLTTGVVAVSAQDEKSGFFGVANRVGVGVGVGTEGIGFDVAVPLTKYVQARLGLNMMPNININTTADVSGEFNGNSITETMDVKGKFSRTTFDVKFDCYPFANSSSFFVTAGFSVGGDKLVKITGHSDRLQQYIAAGNSYNVEIGDYQIPVDRNGDVNGGQGQKLPSLPRPRLRPSCAEEAFWCPLRAWSTVSRQACGLCRRCWRPHQGA